jgi:N-acetylglucosaminyldiphosphoundecaprenol N-acetyl-beta-D-mannosaminyltransferase
MKRIGVLSVEIAAASRELLKDEIVTLLQGAKGASVAKVNAEFLLRALHDAEFRRCLASTHLNIADGVGVLWAARFLTLSTTKRRGLRQMQILGQAVYSLASLVLFPRFCRAPIPERIPGVDALFLMLEAAQAVGASVYFLGAEEEINQRARREIQACYPRLVIAGGRGGYWDDDAAVLREIDRSGAKLLVVALGSPTQEYWTRDHLAALGQVRVAVGEGGSLDFIAGGSRRAPGWMQRLGLEWLWRLFMNRNKTGSTGRGRRVWNAVPVFICHVVRWKLRHGRTGAGDRSEA